MELYFFPLGPLNNQDQRHLLGESQVPYAENLQYFNGTWRKRLGLSLVVDFGVNVLGGYRASEAHLIFFLQDGTAKEWNMIANAASSDYDLTEIGSGLTVLAPDGSTYNRWNFTTHDDDNVLTVAIATNGLDRIQKYDVRGWSAAFTLGGAVTGDELFPGDEITGDSSGETANVVAVSVTSGTWAGGDAAGTLYVTKRSGTFTALETVDRTSPASNNILKVTTAFTSPLSDLTTVASIGFTLGVEEPTAGDTISLNATPATTAVVVEVTLSSGAWDGTGVGTIYVVSQSDVFGNASIDNDTTTTNNVMTLDAAFAGGGQHIKGLYPQSFYKALYIANITDDGTVSTPTATDPYGITWSEIGDASTFLVNHNLDKRTEDGKPITSLEKTGDNLILGKGSAKTKNQNWKLVAYDAWSRISTDFGIQQHDGAVDGDRFIFNDKGRILDIAGNWINYPVANLFSASNPGKWDVSGVSNLNDEQFRFSIGNNMFFYRLLYDSWEYYKFTRKVRLIASLDPGRPASQSAGIAGLHTAMSANEEALSSDYVVIFNDTKLCVMNHFNSDFGNAIQTVIETQTREPNPGQVSRYTQVVIDAGASQGPFIVKGFFPDSPTRSPSWETLGTISTNSEGKARLPINKSGQWVALRLETSSTGPVDHYRIGVRHKPHGRER